MRVELKRFLAVLLCAFATAAFVGGCSTGDRNSSRGINAGDDADPGGNGGNGSQCTEEDGLICTVQEVLDGLGEGTPVEQLTDLINQLVDPDGGDLAALTEALDDLTATDAELAALNDLVEGLTAADQDGALAPLIDALNGILMGETDPEQLQGLLGSGMLTDLLGGLLGGDDGGDGGSDGNGLIDDLNAFLDETGDGGQLEPLTDVLNQLTAPEGGDLEALTGALNDLSQEELELLSQLGDTLLDPEVDGALVPLAETINDLTSAGLDPGSFSPEGLAALLDPAALEDLLGGIGLF